MVDAKMRRAAGAARDTEENPTNKPRSFDGAVIRRCGGLYDVYRLFVS